MKLDISARLCTLWSVIRDSFPVLNLRRWNNHRKLGSSWAIGTATQRAKFAAKEARQAACTHTRGWAGASRSTAFVYLAKDFCYYHCLVCQKNIYPADPLYQVMQELPLFTPWEHMITQPVAVPDECLPLYDVDITDLATLARGAV